MSSSVNEANLEKKFQAVINTQDSIQTLSLWILHHRAHHKKIVDIWLKVLKKAKINHRLTLFYLANDVVQNGKRKGYPQFGEAFSEVLKEATLLVRNEKIQSSVERVFTIWGQRNVYGSAFISELQSILVNSKVPPKSVPPKLLEDFKHENVIGKIRQVLALEADTAAKLSLLNINKLDATKAEISQQLKDRSHGQKFSCDFDEATSCLEDVIECLEKEVKQRAQLILLLEQSEIYYETQRVEAKIVANAYKNFGSKIKTLQKKLEERKASLPSPIPSPCVDAPSPINSDPDADTEELPRTKSQPGDSDSLDNAPSPVGSPEGLALTPPHSEKAAQENNVGNPIPTLSNFFPQASGMMSSWLDTFSSSSKNSTSVINSPTVDGKKGKQSSLDSRLSNLMQNIPHLSRDLQSSLFGGSSSGSASPVHEATTTPSYGKDAASSSDAREVTTPVKDECSGQNTPLQDEDIQSSNHSGFFSPPSTSSKTSQNSKDVLKGLTNLIQTVTSVAVEKPDYNQKQNISEFIKKIAPTLTHLSPHSSSSPITFLHSPQNTFVSQPNENVHSSPRPVMTTSPSRSRTFSNSSYSPSQMDPYSGNSPTTAMHENLSFIPTLVPSTPHDGSFDFATDDDYPADEYNPESENYLPMESSDDLCPVDTPSPTLLEETCESPDDLSDDDIPKSMSNQRQSTLITLVTDEKTTTADHSSPGSEGSMSHHPEESEYLSQNIMQGADVIQNAVSEAWPPVNMQLGEDGGLVHPQENLTVPEPARPSESFIGDHDERPNMFSPVVPPPPLPEQVTGPLNGGCETSFAPPSGAESNLVCYPLSKIETVQSHRNDVDNRWFGNDWGRGGFHGGQRPNPFHANDHRPNFNRRPFDQRSDYQFRRGGGPHSNFRPRSNNWQPRERRFSDYEQGQPYPKRFAPFPGRGRGWRNNNYQQQ